MVLYSQVRKQFARRTQPTKLAAAAVDLQPGTVLTAANLTLVDWPTNIPVEGAAKTPDELIGRIVLFTVAQKVPIRQNMLAPQGSGLGLAAKIPGGMRALAVKTNELNNVSGFLFPGSRVDVLVTMRPSNGRDAMTTTVLQDVLVLSTGAKLEPDAGGKPQSVKEVKDVTVLVTPEEAAKLVLAVEQGTVQFVLRNGADEDQQSAKTVELRELQGIREIAAVAPPVVRSHAAAPKASGEFEAETFVGTKRSVVKF